MALLICIANSGSLKASFPAFTTYPGRGKAKKFKQVGTSLNESRPVTATKLPESLAHLLVRQDGRSSRNDQAKLALPGLHCSIVNHPLW